MPINVEQIGEPAAEVSGGFSHTEIRIGFLENFASLDQPKDIEGDTPATTLTELVTIVGDHTFNAGVGFTKVKALLESVLLETTQMGPKFAHIQENKLTFQMLGSKDEILGFKRLIKNKDLIVLAPEFASGNVRQIGSAKFAGSVLESSGKIDGVIEGENTATFVIQDKQLYDAPIYKGAITDQPAP